MESTPQFRSDLYRDTAYYYDRYRVAYPAALVDDLVERAGLTGRGRLLDLACGPGRVTFAVCRHFADVLAIDQEDESIGYARAVASERGAGHARWFTGRAEDLDLDGGFELVTIGDAFHRLDRHRVAALARKWLQPAGHVALLWTTMPWQGSAPWQAAVMDWVLHWMEAAGSRDNIPSNLEETLVRTPHLTVLANAGFEVVGTYEFGVPYAWTLEALIGLAHSTSILSRPVLGGHSDDCERDLRDRLRAVQPDGDFEETINFTYDLASRP